MVDRYDAHSLISPTDARRLFLSRQLHVVSHRFSSASVFEPQELARLLTCHPRAAISFDTDTTTPCRMRETIGERWLRQIATGRSDQRTAPLLRATQLLDYHPDLAGAIDGLFDELEVRNRGTRIIDRTAELWLFGRAEHAVSSLPEGDYVWWQIVGATHVTARDKGRRWELPAGSAMANLDGPAIVGRDQLNVALVTRHRVASTPCQNVSAPSWLTRLGRELAKSCTAAAKTLDRLAIDPRILGEFA